MEWLAGNQVTGFAALVSAVATVVLAITTIVYAWHTSQLADENRRLRKAGSDPQVVAYLTINPRVSIALDFVLANVGRGPAKNVRCQVIAGDDFAEREVLLRMRDSTFGLLPQDEAIRTAFGMGPELLGDEPLRPFEVKISYQNFDGEAYSQSFTLDVAPFSGSIQLGEPSLDKIAKSAKQIADSIQKIAKG